MLGGKARYQIPDFFEADLINPSEPKRTIGATSGNPALSEVFSVFSDANESEWIAALIRGDGQAWQELVDRYAGLVRSRVADVAAIFGKRYDQSLIDDVTAEVFATLLARDSAALRCFRLQSSLSTYLAVIATRIARRVIGRMRRCEHESTMSIDKLPVLSPQSNAESLLINREDRERLLALVDRLPPRQKELLVAFYEDQRTYAEISLQFGVPIGSIGTTLRRAEEKLRQWIDDETE